MTQSNSSLSRGIRNHNPGNLRRTSDQWEGLASIQADPDFFVFISPVYGIRALAITLINYQDRHGLKSIANIISRWAPNTENDTAAYVRAVARDCGVEKDAQIQVRDYLEVLVRAIIVHENGAKYRDYYDPEVIRQGIAKALADRPGPK